MYKVEKFYPKGFNPQQYWDDKYSREHIAGASSEEYRQQGFWPLLEQHLEKDKSYLDAGCGIGGWIIFLKEEGYHVKGIDIAARTVRALTEYDPDLEVRVAPITAIPYPDNSFDGVLAIGTLEYVENRVDAALDEVKRVLRPGGFIFIEVPLANTLRRWIYLPLKSLERLIKTRQNRKPTFANYLFLPSTLKQRLADHGYEVVAIQPHEIPGKDSHYGLYIDFKIFRGSEPYRLNALGRLVRLLADALSPWIASTGMIIVARKRV